MATINVTSKKTDRHVEFEFDLGETVQRAVELFGETAVKDIFDAGAIVLIQGVARRTRLLSRYLREWAGARLRQWSRQGTRLQARVAGEELATPKV